MDCLKMLFIRQGEFTYKVPCGKCAFCLTNKRSSWMFRIAHEIKNQEYRGWFLTMTYNERCVKRAPDGRLSLRFRDVQLFIKKLRKSEFYVRYLCVGEYGSATKRPHYHMLLWTDATPDQLQRTWSYRNKSGALVQLGEIHFGTITMQSAMYTLKYIIQPKQRDVGGIEKTRAQFSKGLGLSYLSSAVYNYHTADYECPELLGMVDGKPVALPRYYRLKIFTKYQLGQEREKVKGQKCREEIVTWRKLMRELGSPHKKSWREYLQALRVDRANQILSTTKLQTYI